MRAVRRTLMLVAGPVALALVIACGGASSTVPLVEAIASPTAISPTASPTTEPTRTPTPTPSPTPSPSPTATPEPTATPTPSPTATSAPAAESQGSGTSDAGADSDAAGPLDGLISRLANETWDFLVELTLDHSPRESASEEEKAAADFLVEVFEDIGYEVELQPFTFSLLSTDGPLLTLTQPEQLDIEGVPLRLAGIGQVTGLFVDVGLARVGDVPEGGLAGKIAFIRRGVITFEQKVHRVEDAGAVAAVIYNIVPNLFSGTLLTPSGIPAVAISQSSGEIIREAMARGEVEATVTLVMKTFESRNVIAEKPGTGNDGRVLVLGAHYDTVPDTQGANDNGSGLTALLTIAREVADESFPFTLRFIAFGSEEIGLFGSRHYVAELADDDAGNIVAMLNFDVPGSGRQIQVIGSSDLAKRVLAYGDANGIGVRAGLPLEGGGSDHVPFRSADVPTLFFLADDLSRINSPLDTIEFVDRRLMGETVALALGLLDDLARQLRE